MGKISTQTGSKSSGVVGKIGATFFFLIFVAFGLGGTVLFGLAALQTIDTYRWKEASATILSSSVQEDKGKEDPFFVAVTYRYTWEGKSYTSDKYAPSRSSYGDYNKALERAEMLPADTTITCYVNPKDPAEAVLRRDPLWFVPLALLPLIFAAVGGAGIYGTWFSRSSRSSTASQPANSKGCVLLFGGLFVVAGAAVLFLWYLPELTKSISSTKWAETPCTVLSSRVKTHSGDSITYSVDIFYAYQFEGRDYKSNRYGLFGGSSSGYRGKAAVVARYPAGSKAVCYVDPKNPRDAVLKRGLGWEALFGLLPLVFIGAGLLVMRSGGLRSKVTGGRQNRPESLEPGGGPTVLKPKSGPWMKLGGAILFTLVWNGIVSLLIFHAVDDVRHSSLNWGLALFAVPFVLVGLAAIGTTVYLAFALANPRCCLRISQSILTPGATLEVSWMFSGSVQRMQKLRIYLEGREEATYRRGTSNTTDRHVFARLVIAEIDSWMEMNEGRGQCVLPEGVAPSFASSNNKIVWSVKVHGSIPTWPDVNEEFEVLVSPAGGRR